MTTSGTIKATWEMILGVVLGYTMIILFQKMTEKTNYSFKNRKTYLNYRRFVDKSTNKSSCIFTIIIMLQGKITDKRDTKVLIHKCKTPYLVFVNIGQTQNTRIKNPILLQILLWNDLLTAQSIIKSWSIKILLKT